MVNIISREFLSNFKIKVSHNSNPVHAFLVMYSICLCQMQSLDRAKLRCLCEDT